MTRMPTDVKHRLLQAFAKGGKQLMNRLVNIWSRAEETPRILAFMCIVKVGHQFVVELFFISSRKRFGI